MGLSEELAMSRVQRGLELLMPLVKGLYKDYGDERLLVTYNAIRASVEILKGNM